MATRQYRSTLYENYATIQVPIWNESNIKHDAVWTHAVMNRLHGWLPPDKSAQCLDIGCGSGLLLQMLRDAGYSHLSGVDISPQAVAIATKLGFKVIQADILGFLRDSHKSYDLIVAFDVVEHFDKDELIELATLILRRLTPKGRFILQTPNALSPWSASVRYGDLTHEWIFDPRCLASTLKMIGFNDIRIREITPYVHGIFSALRWTLWSLIRMGCAAWNLAETGATEGNVYTRNMVAVASKPPELHS
jgi:2-polyprenyl-3-methyl-5-hydroxy-6-metoxy-1,4-benzoquinol methylase